MKVIGTTDVDPDPGCKKTPKMRTRIAEKMREKNVNFYLNLIPYPYLLVPVYTGTIKTK